MIDELSYEELLRSYKYALESKNEMNIIFFRNEIDKRSSESGTYNGRSMYESCENSNVDNYILFLKYITYWMLAICILSVLIFIIAKYN